MDDQYKALAKKALDILEIEYNDDAQLDELITLLEKAFPFVGSSTEIELNKIVNNIAEKLKNKEDIEEIKSLLEALEDNYLFSKYWD